MAYKITRYKSRSAVEKKYKEKRYRFRKNYKELPEKPDIVFTKYKIEIFRDGEFFMEKTGKCLKLNWKKVIIVNIGLVKYLETESGRMKSTKNFFFLDGR